MSGQQENVTAAYDVDMSDVILRDFLNEHAPDTANTEDAEDYTFTDTIDVLVGPRRVRFTIHPDVACTDSSSRFLKAVISRDWYRGFPIELEHIDPETFECYLEWVYGGLRESPLSDGMDSFHYRALEYVCADQINDLATMNHIMDDLVELRRGINALPHKGTVKLVYESLPPRSPMRRWLEEIHAYYAPPDVFELRYWQHRDPPEDFLIGVSKILRRVPAFETVIAGYSSAVSLRGRIVQCLTLGRMPDSYRDLLKRGPCRYHYHDTKYTAIDQGCPAPEL